MQNLVLRMQKKKNSNHIKTILLNERQNDGHGKAMLHLVFVPIKVEL